MQIEIYNILNISSEKLPSALSQSPSHFELCHQCSLKGDGNDPPYLSKPFQAALGKQQTASVPSVTQQSTLVSLYLSRPGKRKSQREKLKKRGQFK